MTAQLLSEKILRTKLAIIAVNGRLTDAIMHARGDIVKKLEYERVKLKRRLGDLQKREQQSFDFDRARGSRD